jgi:hypothetical protein
MFYAKNKPAAWGGCRIQLFTAARMSVDCFFGADALDEMCDFADVFPHQRVVAPLSLFFDRDKL